MGVTVKEFIEDTIMKCDKTVHIDDLFDIYMICMTTVGENAPEALEIIKKLGRNAWNGLMETAMVSFFTSVYGSVLDKEELQDFIDNGLPNAEGTMTVMVENNIGDA